MSDTFDDWADSGCPLEDRNGSDKRVTTNSQKLANVRSGGTDDVAEAKGRDHTEHFGREADASIMRMPSEPSMTKSKKVKPHDLIKVRASELADKMVSLHVNGGVKFGHCGGAKVGQFGASALERAALI